AFVLQLALEPLERQLQSADALQLDRANDELILPTRLVNREVALDDEFLAVLEQIAVLDAFAAKEHAVQLGVGVLEREINVAGTLYAQVGGFARYPDEANRLFEQALHLSRQLADGQDAPRRFGWKQLAEVPLGFGLLAHRIQKY